MACHRYRIAILTFVALSAVSAAAQDMPAEYKAVLDTLGKKGDFKDGVLKVNIPRTDLRVTIAGRPAPTPFGFGGWLALTKGGDGDDVLMGDLVLTQAEVNPVMSALLDNGLDVTALHNHFFWEEPRVFYMHVHGMGPAETLARKVQPAVRLIDAAVQRVSPPAAPPPPVAGVTGAAVAAILGHEGEQTGPVYKITIGRPDIDLRAHGARINTRMGLNTWAAFAGTDADAMVAGDVAMLESEVTPVLKALRANGLDVVAIHHHMTDVKPAVVFLHYFGRGPAERLARGVRAAVDRTGGVRTARNVLFLCPHGAAKSVLAAAYFKKLAQERGLDVHADTMGTEPDPAVSPKVAQHLQAQGIAVPIARPKLVTPKDLETADIVVTMGCDLGAMPVRGHLRRWDEVPSPSADFEGTDAAIKRRVDALVDELVGRSRR
jgi:protein-tyrosine-phosphatase